MKHPRLLVLSVIAMIMAFMTAGFASDQPAKWSDWSKMEQDNIFYRSRCNVLSSDNNQYVWDIEVRNKSGEAAKIAVAVTEKTVSAPSENSWMTFPVVNGGRHEFSGIRSQLSPAGTPRIWLKNLSNKMSSAENGSWNRYDKGTKGKDALEGQTFNGCSKTWLVGKADIDWNATQTWIKSLGEGWRSPNKDELIALFQELGQNSPIGQDFVWAEKRDANSAWHFSFYYREVRWGYFDDHSKYGRAVAVR